MTVKSPLLLCTYLAKFCNVQCIYHTIVHAILTMLSITPDTESMRAIASTLIHAVLLCESAQRYRALMYSAILRITNDVMIVLY